MVYEFLGLLVESYGTWLLLQRLVDASKDSDIPINNRNTLELAQIATVDKRMWKDSFSQIRKFEYSIRIRTLCFSQYSNLESSFVAIRSLLVYIPTAKMIVNIWKVTSRGNFPGSIHNEAELTLLFVPARNTARARQKGWGPWSKYSEFAYMEKFHTVVSTLQRQTFMSRFNGSMGGSPVIGCTGSEVLRHTRE